ncbi:MAG: RNA polymerase sporulation sigma factor SigE, partial [Firmicutes bacterium]|nr:RNA polymerase sporulation sigma factor SigE [Bacillota bacterium]
MLIKIILKILGLYNKKDVFYINSANTLPAPLSPEEEAALTEKLSTPEADNAKKILIERNLRLAVFIAKKFENTGINMEDL